MTSETGIFGNDFVVIRKLGEGSFSEVYEVKSKRTNETYAIKRLKKRYRSLDEANHLEEIWALRALQGHPNIIRLKDILYDSLHGYLAIVFEEMDCNLYELIRDLRKPLSENVTLLLMYQLLKAIALMHSKCMFHRDIKPENCMVNRQTFELKLADFGSTRQTTARGPFTEYIATRWYRAPECILTAGSYGPAVDIWAVGCIFYEILTGKPLFPGKHELDQIFKIHSILGTPSNDILVQFKANPNKNLDMVFPPRPSINLQAILPNTSYEIVDLISQLLVYSPVDRITADEALNHQVFDKIKKEEEIWDGSEKTVSFAEYFLSDPTEKTTIIQPKKPVVNPNAPASYFTTQYPNQPTQPVQPLIPKYDPVQPPKKPVVPANVMNSRRIAAERIKQWNQQHISTKKPQPKYKQPISIGAPKYKPKPVPQLYVGAVYLKPKPEIVQPRLPPIGTKYTK